MNNIFSIFIATFSYAGNWELVKPIVVTKYGKNYVSLNSPASCFASFLFFSMLLQLLYKN